ncbi:TOMM precursor leader peptide-binding protein [Streptomyces sp. ISL-43]|uniref:TOMM precursor leader peptide-binding protein n=1 Tax=Streptomyces sp. ISL-43 TaxID=2819183 RepID=UPI001BE4E476|nr:TOMM precursor leader peptide-binding protein [Streptomyces sp. ISL-43]MBT2445599.1 TOMM precursor leader peptide-binding protein [Streptomyces sp. ISL-43]
MTKVHVLAVGEFGEAVAERMLRHHDAIEVTAGQDAADLAFPARWPVADIRVLVSWREVPALAEVLDAQSADWGTPWFAVVNEHPRLRVGPVVVPGEGACYRCFRGRRAQHEQGSTLTAALHAHYDAHPTAGPGGFLPQHTAMAAGAALQLLHGMERDGGCHDAGSVRHWHLLEQHISHARVVGVHGCDRCRPRSGQERPSWEALAQDLSGLLPPADADSRTADRSRPAGTEREDAPALLARD